MPSPSRSALRIALTLVAVYLFWGSTAPAMKLAIATLPTFLMVGVRFLIAGTILWTVARWTRVPLPKASEWPTAFVSGTILLVLSNAVFCWSLQTMPSGLGSLFFALSPLWMTIFAAVFDRERITTLGVAGLTLGLAGMAVIYAPLAGGALPLWGIAVDAFVSVAWAFGSILQRRFFSTDVLQSSAMQMLCAAPVCLAISLVTHEPWQEVSRASVASLASVAYLVVFGSLVGYSGYLWLTRNVPTTLASTYAYVNPIVAIAIGTIWLKESLTWNSAAGAIVVVAGVAMMMLVPRKTVPEPAVALPQAPARGLL